MAYADYEYYTAAYLGKTIQKADFPRLSLRASYAIANGLPVWCNLMMAVMDEIDTTFTREQKLTNPRISKYTAKYQKYQKK